MCPAAQTMGRVIEDAMASDAPLTDGNAHVAALCSMVELFLQHGLNPSPPGCVQPQHHLSVNVAAVCGDVKCSPARPLW